MSTGDPLDPHAPNVGVTGALATPRFLLLLALVSGLFEAGFPDRALPDPELIFFCLSELLSWHHSYAAFSLTATALHSRSKVILTDLPSLFPSRQQFFKLRTIQYLLLP